MSMVAQDGTAVRVDSETWQRLSELKLIRGPNASFNDVISDLLDTCGDDVKDGYS